MEQRAVARFLTLKGLNTPLIHSELESVYQEDALALWAIYKWRRRFRGGSTGRLKIWQARKSDLTEPISSISKERPSSSCKLIARHFRVAKATCLRILH
jgi:hypothetical protein